MTLTLPSAFLVRLSASTRRLGYGYLALLPGFILAVVTEAYRLHSSGTLLFVTPWGLRAAPLRR